MKKRRLGKATATQLVSELSGSEAKSLSLVSVNFSGRAINFMFTHL